MLERFPSFFNRYQLLFKKKKINLPFRPKFQENWFAGSFHDYLCFKFRSVALLFHRPIEVRSSLKTIPSLFFSVDSLKLSNQTMRLCKPGRTVDRQRAQSTKESIEWQCTIYYIKSELRITRFELRSVYPHSGYQWPDHYHFQFEVKRKIPMIIIIVQANNCCQFFFSNKAKKTGKNKNISLINILTAWKWTFRLIYVRKWLIEMMKGKRSETMKANIEIITHMAIWSRERKEKKLNKIQCYSIVCLNHFKLTSWMLLTGRCARYARRVQ